MHFPQSAHPFNGRYRAGFTVPTKSLPGGGSRDHDNEAWPEFWLTFSTGGKSNGEKLSCCGHRRRRHRARSRAGGHRGARSGRAALRLRPGMARIRLELRNLCENRPHDAGRRARPAAALRLGISRRGRLSRRAGPCLAVGVVDPAAPQLPAIYQSAPGAADGRRRIAAEGARSRRHRFLCRAREQRGRVFLGRRPALRGHRPRNGDAAGRLHAARL